MLKQKLEKILGKVNPARNVTEKAGPTNQQVEISEVSLTRSPSRFLGVLRLLPRLRNTRFRGCGLRDGRTWREGVLSFKQRRCNETDKYHRAQQSPHENDWLPGNENVHRRPPQTKSGLRLQILYCEFPRTFFVKIVLVVNHDGVLQQILTVAGLWLQNTRTGNRVHSKPGWRKPRKYEPGGTPTRSTSAFSITM
jgi:hypothetical protein